MVLGHSPRQGSGNDSPVESIKVAGTGEGPRGAIYRE